MRKKFQTFLIPVDSKSVTWSLKVTLTLKMTTARRVCYLFLLASCSGVGSVVISVVTLATVCGEPSFGAPSVELLALSFSSTGEVLGLDSFTIFGGFVSSVFSTPFVTIFSTGVAVVFRFFRLLSLATWLSLLLSPSSSESEYSSGFEMCLSESRTAKKKQTKGMVS